MNKIQNDIIEEKFINTEKIIVIRMETSII
jgi:hypothetical protein